MLEKPDFVTKMVELINKTLNAKELEGSDTQKASTSKTANEGENECLTNEDLENIMSLTQNDPNYDEIVQEVIDKYLTEEFPTTSKTSTPIIISNTSKKEDTEAVKTPTIIEVPIKERLRSRSAKKVNVKVKNSKKKINIISNEVLTRKVPEFVDHQNYCQTTIIDNLQCQQLLQEPQLLINMPIYLQNGLEMLPFSITTGSYNETSTISVPFTIDQNMIIPVATIPVQHEIVTQIEQPLIIEPPFMEEELAAEPKDVDAEKKEDTPKRTMSANYLQSKSKSTPRRKATHVRTLDFTSNITPTRFLSKKRMSTIQEFTTPHSAIRLSTPGSAPATINASKIKITKVVPNAVTEPEVSIDDNSMSNSISNTPKVVKNPRSCARKLSNSSEDSEQKLMMKKLELKRETVKKPIEQKTFSLDDWKQLRSVAKSNTWDQHIRSINSNQADTETKTNKSRKTPRKNQKQKKAKTLSPEGEPEKENDAQNVGVVAAVVETEVSIETKVTETSTESKDLMKFRIASPRKAALKSPAKKSKILTQKVKGAVEVAERKKVNPPKKKKRLVKVPNKKVTKLKIPAQSIESTEQQGNEQEPSEAMQEVAATLSELSTTILSEVTTTPNENPMVRTISQTFNMASLLETPFKAEMLTIPNTPRFAIPLTLTHETPFPKSMVTTTTNGDAISVVKNCDIQTPSFPITPGFSGTPRSGNEGSPTGEGYQSRRTDYSSCSSYYKPDDTEEPIVKQDSMTKYRHNSDRNSESDVSTYAAAKLKGSAKKVDCPGVIERVKSFNEDQNTIPMPHYTMLNEDCLLNESFMTKEVTSDTSSSDSSSSSGSDSDSSCSSCSSSSSSDDDADTTVKKRNSSTMKKLEQAASTDDKDSDWKCDEKEIVGVPGNCSNSLVDEKGEVRFPMRSWITPKKIEVSEPPKVLSAQTMERRKSLYAAKTTDERSQAITELEEKKKRTLEKLRNDVPTTSSRTLGKVEKLKRANVKAYKIPASTDHVVASNKDKILQRSNTERSRPTPLKLIPSTSKRKNATPRKIVYLDKIPTLSPTKRANFKRAMNTKRTATASKESVKVVQVAEQMKPEAVVVVVEDPVKEVTVNKTIDETPNSSINSISTDVETLEMEVVSAIVEEAETLGDKSDFNIEQEVEESVVECENVEEPLKEVEAEKVVESENDEESESEAELDFALSTYMESFTFNAAESSEKPSESKSIEETTRPPNVYEINDVKYTISDSETQVLFSIDPTPVVSIVKMISNVQKKTKNEEKKGSSSRHHKRETDKTKSKSTDKEIPVGTRSSKPTKAEDKKKNEKSKKPEDSKKQHKQKEVKK